MIVENIDYNLIYDIISEKNYVEYISEITIEDTIEYENGETIQKDVIVIYYQSNNYHTDEFFIDVDEYQERIRLLRDMKINQILK
jgi:hypothetical protein